jgi:hypothetical protein
MRGRPSDEVRNLEQYFLGSESPIPAEDGIWLGDTGDLLERSATESLTELSESKALGVREAQTGGKVSSEDAVLDCQTRILEQEFSD